MTKKMKVTGECPNGDEEVKGAIFKHIEKEHIMQ